MRCGGLILSYCPRNPHGKAGNEERRTLFCDSFVVKIRPCFRVSELTCEISKFRFDFWNLNFFTPFFVLVNERPKTDQPGYVLCTPLIKNLFYTDSFVNYSIVTNKLNW